MTELMLFGSTFFLVFLMGLQSQNVVHGHYVAAFMTSIGIGLGNFVLFTHVPDASGTEVAAYLSGGPFGIVLSMWVHRNTLSKWRERRRVASRHEPTGSGASSPLRSTT